MLRSRRTPARLVTADAASGYTTSAGRFFSLWARGFRKHRKKYTTVNTRHTAAITPVLPRKSKKLSPREVPMIMLGGSPHIVAEPPRLAQKISARIIGTGSKYSVLASSAVTAARNRITVMLSMNMARSADITIKQISSGTVR